MLYVLLVMLQLQRGLGCVVPMLDLIGLVAVKQSCNSKNQQPYPGHGQQRQSSSTTRVSPGQTNPLPAGGYQPAPSATCHPIPDPHPPQQQHRPHVVTTRPPPCQLEKPPLPIAAVPDAIIVSYMGSESWRVAQTCQTQTCLALSPRHHQPPRG